MMDRMRHRAGAMLGALVIALLASGCTPEPTPTPSPTGFASEEEAFAAAEATYRAYVDAVNARSAGDSSPPIPTDFLIGSALQGELESERQFEALGIRLGGPMSISKFRWTDADDSRGAGLVCLDVTMARVVDLEDKDVTPTDRANYLGLAVEFAWAPGGALITQSLPDESACS